MRFVYFVSMVVIASGAGCKDDGGGGGHLADAPTQQDDAPIDAGPLPITLTVTLDGAPVAGVHTYFLKADGTLGDTVDTNAQGVASSLKADGGSVTAIDPFGLQQGADDLRTFMKVKAGDHLVLSDTREPASISVTVTAPLGANSNESWQVITACGGGELTPGIDDNENRTAPTGTFDLSGCNGAVDLLVITRDEVSNVVETLYQPGQVLPLTGEVNIDLSNKQYVSVRDVAISYTNLPLDVNGVTADYTPATVGGLMRDLGEERDSDGIQEGSATLSFNGMPTNPQLGAVIDGFWTVFGSFHSSRHHLISFKPVGMDQTFDMTNLVLPNFTERPEYDVETRSVKWTEDAIGATADLTFVTLSVQRNIDVRAATPELPPPGTTWRWQVVAPYAAGEIKFPTLPTDIADWAPAVNEAQVQDITSAKVPGGYDAVRAKILNDVGPQEIVINGSILTVELGPTPARGTTTRTASRAPTQGKLTGSWLTKRSAAKALPAKSLLTKAAKPSVTKAAKTRATKAPGAKVSAAASRQR